MKRIISILAAVLSAMMLFSITACQGGTTTEGDCIVHDYGENHLCVDNACLVCGEVKPASAMHAYGEWVSVTTANCLRAGLKSHTCTQCGYTESVSVPKTTTHNYVGGVCSDCGEGEGGAPVVTPVDVVTMAGQTFAITGGQYTVKAGAGYTEGEAFVITPDSDALTVWFFSSEYEELPVGTLKGVNCRMYIEAKGEIDLKKPSGYSQNVKLVNAEGMIVDYAYPLETWCKITVDAKIAELGGRKGAKFVISDAAGETITLSDFTTDDNVMVLENLFGGVKVVQWQYPGALMQCYFIISPDGTIMAMDGGADGSEGQIEGAKEALYAYMVENGLQHVDHWFLTHYHGDHTGSLMSILDEEDKEITIDNLYYDFPTVEHVSNYEGTATITKCYTVIEKSLANGRVKKVVTPKKTDEYVLDGYMSVRILNDAYFYSKNNMGNDSSVVFKLVTPGADIAFLGDMSYFYGDTLIKDQYFYDEISTCEVIQMGHHGQNGCSEYFYQQCKAMKICLYPGPSWVFDAGDEANGYNHFYTSGIQTMLTRQWVREIGIKYSYGGDQTLVIGK